MKLLDAASRAFALPLLARAARALGVRSPESITADAGGADALDALDDAAVGLLHALAVGEPVPAGLTHEQLCALATAAHLARSARYDSAAYTLRVSGIADRFPPPSDTVRLARADVEAILESLRAPLRGRAWHAPAVPVPPSVLRAAAHTLQRALHDDAQGRADTIPPEAPETRDGSAP